MFPTHDPNMLDGWAVSTSVIKHSGWNILGLNQGCFMETLIEEMDDFPASNVDDMYSQIRLSMIKHIRAVETTNKLSFVWVGHQH